MLVLVALVSEGMIVHYNIVRALLTVSVQAILGASILGVVVISWAASAAVRQAEIE